MAILPVEIDMVVNNMKASLAFYRLLGLDIPEGQDEEAMAEIITTNGYHLSWSTVAMMVQQGGDKWAKLPARGRMRLGFQCDSPAEVDAVYERVIAAGYTSESAPWDAFWGQRFTQLVDPDGALVDIFAPLQ